MIGLLLVGSLVFYRERMLFVDPAFITFEILQQDWFVFSEHRYGAFITQAFPLIGDRLGLSLKTILIGYSMSFYLFFTAVIVVCGSLLKQYKLAILFCCYLTFIVSDVYFWPNNEVHQAIGWMIGFLSMYTWSQERDWKVPIWVHGITVVLLGLATISHLLIVVPLGFLWMYSVLDKWHTDRKSIVTLFIYSILILGFVGFRYWMSKDSWYDGGKLDGVQTATLDKLFTALSNDQATTILTLLLKRYWVAVLVLIVGLVSLFQKRAYLKIGLTLMSLFVYFSLVTMTHSVAIDLNNLFYFESQWMCMSIIMATPFVFEVLGRLRTSRIVLIAAVIIFGLQIPKLYQGLTKFQSRLVSLENLVDKAANAKISKGYVIEKSSLNDTFLMTWGLPIETLLLSSIETDKPATTIKPLKADRKVILTKDSVYTAFDLIPISDLDSDHFRLDAESSYQKLD